MVIRIIEIEIETETETIYPKEKVIGGTILLIQEIGKKTGELFISFEKKKLMYYNEEQFIIAAVGL